MYRFFEHVEKYSCIELCMNYKYHEYVNILYRTTNRWIYLRNNVWFSVDCVGIKLRGTVDNGPRHRRRARREPCPETSSGHTHHSMLRHRSPQVEPCETGLSMIHAQRPQCTRIACVLHAFRVVLGIEIIFMFDDWNFFSINHQLLIEKLKCLVPLTPEPGYEKCHSIIEENNNNWPFFYCDSRKYNVLAASHFQPNFKIGCTVMVFLLLLLNQYS